GGCMTDLGTYSFLPWLRQGIANRIATPDGDPAVVQRASVTVALEIVAANVGGGETRRTVSRDVALYGPGDIIGLQSRAIVRTEPRDHVTDFEPNYLPCIEFYDEDLPWRYTPAAPDAATGRARPWITLVVLADGEFTEGRDTAGK